MMPRPRPHLDDQSGLTLVEILVYLVVGGILTGLVTTIFISTMQANATTGNRDVSTARAQIVSTDLSTTVRNAYAVSVDGAAGIVRASLASGECRAWADVSGDIRTTSYAPVASGSAPAPAASWGLLASGVSATFAQNGDRLDWTLTVSTQNDSNLSDAVSATVTGAAVASAEGTAPTCW